MGVRQNVLFIVIDQLRADVVGGALGAAVATPNLDRFGAGATRFDKHFTVTAPCGPSRASLLTGQYAMNHRSIRNGSPLAADQPNLALEARKAGYEPLLFGYTDIQPDPRRLAENDPENATYERVLPGFREITEMRMGSGVEWPAYLRAQGYDVPRHAAEDDLTLYRPQGDDLGGPALYAAAHSDTAFLTDRTIEALDQRVGRPWFAHVAYIRPHPPLVAPAPYHDMVDPREVAAAITSAPDHPTVDAYFSAPAGPGLFWGCDGDYGAFDAATVALLRATYLGLVAEVDAHLGRLFDWLDASGEAPHTLVVATADHGEMLGDKKMWGKDAVYDPALHVPLLVRVPGLTTGRTISAITESIDVMPTILDWLGRPVPGVVDGRSLVPLLDGAVPADWRAHGFFELEFGDPAAATRYERYFGLAPGQCRAAILREADWKYVHFAGGVPPMLFDLAADPHETVDLAPDARHADTLARLRGAMLDHRMHYAGRPFGS